MYLLIVCYDVSVNLANCMKQVCDRMLLILLQKAVWVLWLNVNAEINYKKIHTRKTNNWSSSWTDVIFYVLFWYLAIIYNFFF